MAVADYWLVNTYYPRLDGLRVFAVIAVAVSHWHGPTVFGRGLRLGFLGVALFFVLSGFLIGQILLNAQRKNSANGTSQLFTLRRFLIRRALRIFPAFFLYLAITAVVLGPPDPEWWWYPLYLGNVRIWDLTEWPTYWGHTWSLAVEEQFYLFAPLAVLFLRPRAFRVVLALLTAISGFTLLLGSSVAGIRTTPPAAFYGLLIGVALALLTQNNGRLLRYPSRIGFVAGALCLGAWWLDTSTVGVVLNQAAPLAFAALVFWATGTSAAGKFLELRPFVASGRLAYGLYLWHMVAPYLWRRAGMPLPQNQIGLFVILSSVTFVLAKLSWDLVERPLNDYKKHFPYHPQTPLGLPGDSPRRAEPVQHMR